MYALQAFGICSALDWPSLLLGLLFAPLYPLFLQLLLYLVDLLSQEVVVLLLQSQLKYCGSRQLR